MNEAAFKKLTEEILNPEWLQRPPILVTIVAVIVTRNGCDLKTSFFHPLAQY